MASGPITSWQIDRETTETVRDFILGGAPKSLQIMTKAMKLKILKKESIAEYLKPKNVSVSRKIKWWKQLLKSRIK